MLIADYIRIQQRFLYSSCDKDYVGVSQIESQKEKFLYITYLIIQKPDKVLVTRTTRKQMDSIVYECKNQNTKLQNKVI